MSTWKLTSPKIGGHIILKYEMDLLRSMEIAVHPRLTEKQYDWLFEKLCFNEYTLKLIGMEPFTVSAMVESASLSTHDKIAMFCRMYEQKYGGLKYQVSARDTGQIKLLDLHEDLLACYFSSQNFLFRDKHSIRNLVTYYNEVRAETAGLIGSRLPGYWINELWHRADEKLRKEYLDHLHNCGIHISKTI